MNTLVPQLRERRMFFLNGVVWMKGVSSDDLCQAAADEIERLRKALQFYAEHAGEYADVAIDALKD